MEYNIYIKLTNGCNLKCKHCFNEIMNNHQKMSNEILEKIINWLIIFRNNHLTDNITIILFGGEPMLYDLNKIIYLMDSTKKLDLKWTITTNLIYELTSKHLEIFKRMDKDNNLPLVKTSYDFGNLRFNNNQEKKWKNNVKLLQNNDIMIQPIICVTNYIVENISVKDFYNFIDKNNIIQFNLERITETGRASKNKIKPTNQKQNEWLLNIYKEYEKRNNLLCPLFEGIKQSFKGVFLGCRARRCMEKVITINPDGSIAGCPNIANITYGNLDEINECKKCELIKIEQAKKIECLLCPYYKYCNGDCFQLVWDETGCSGLKNIYEYISKNN